MVVRDKTRNLDDKTNGNGMDQWNHEWKLDLW